jgi:hypothetical protein
MRKINMDAELNRKGWLILSTFLVRSECHTAVLLKIQVFWDVTLCHWMRAPSLLKKTKIFQSIINHSPKNIAPKDLLPITS